MGQLSLWHWLVALLVVGVPVAAVVIVLWLLRRKPRSSRPGGPEGHR